MLKIDVHMLKNFFSSLRFKTFSLLLKGIYHFYFCQLINMPQNVDLYEVLVNISMIAYILIPVVYCSSDTYINAVML